jgi:hypothetical protein
MRDIIIKVIKNSRDTIKKYDSNSGCCHVPVSCSVPVSSSASGLRSLESPQEWWLAVRVCGDEVEEDGGYDEMVAKKELPNPRLMGWVYRRRGRPDWKGIAPLIRCLICTIFRKRTIRHICMCIRIVCPYFLWKTTYVDPKIFQLAWKLNLGPNSLAL